MQTTPIDHQAPPVLVQESPLIPAGKEHFDDARGGIVTFIHEGVILAKGTNSYQDILHANPLFSCQGLDQNTFAYKAGEGSTASGLKRDSKASLTFTPDGKDCPKIADEGVQPAFFISFGENTRVPADKSVRVTLIPKHVDGSLNRNSIPPSIVLKPPLNDKKLLGRWISLDEFSGRNFKNGFDIEITVYPNNNIPADPTEVFSLSITDVYFGLDPKKLWRPPLNPMY